MRITRLDDYQSWLIDVGGVSIAVDPWLTEEFSVPMGRWMLRRRHATTMPFSARRPPSVDLVVLTSHFSDHLDRPSLDAFDRDTAVLTTGIAAPLVRRMGFRDVEVLRPGRPVRFGDAELRGVPPGFPYARVSFGVHVRDRSRGRSLYLETHLTHGRHHALPQNLDVLMTPVEEVKLMGVRLSSGPDAAAELVDRLAPKHFLATGTRPDANEGVLAERVLRYAGSFADFEARIPSRTRVWDPEPGAAVEV